MNYALLRLILVLSLTKISREENWIWPVRKTLKGFHPTFFLHYSANWIRPKKAHQTASVCNYEHEQNQHAASNYIL